MRPISDLAQWAGDLPVVLITAAAGAPARRLLLRALAARVLHLAPEAVIVTHQEGRAPRLAMPEIALHLSSASRAGLAALGVGRAALGIDIEVVEPGREPPWNVLHPDERAWLAGLSAPEQARSFARLWTAKEAYLKALGIGLAREPSSFAILPGSTAGLMRLPDPARAGADVKLSTTGVTHGGRDFAVALAELTIGRGSQDDGAIL
jgi:hypothetical protein